VVVSGGDAYLLPARYLRYIGETLLGIPHIRRIRIASKGLAVMPMKVLTDDDWTRTLADLCELGRRRGKEVAFHTHFNCTAEISEITLRAARRLFGAGVTVRNQSVLIRGVNDSVDEMTALVRQLSYMNVQPYYVYQHDMVKHAEELRTRVGSTTDLERHVRGTTAGFNTPLFIVDLPGGGGKRDVHSFDHYDDATGIAVYRSPSVDEGRVFLYFDPVDLLPAEGQARWHRTDEHAAMIEEAIAAAGLEGLSSAVPVRTPSQLRLTR
jgi:lysine 2,3-aminomutase